MRSILGIDAAWTLEQPSGVALIQADSDRSRVLCVAPSYKAFVDAGRGNPVNWQSPQFRGDEPDILELLQAARSLGVNYVDLIALDIPLAHTEVQSRVRRTPKFRRLLVVEVAQRTPRVFPAPVRSARNYSHN